MGSQFAASKVCPQPDRRYRTHVTDHTVLLAELPPEQRLALAYGPVKARLPLLALLALDGRLAATQRHHSEPMLGQLRLAWWRDELRKPPEIRAKGEPLLALIGQCWHNSLALEAIVDGWEAVLSAEQDNDQAVGSLIAARAQAFAALGLQMDQARPVAEVERAATGWALCDVVARLADVSQREAVIEMAKRHDWRRASLPRDMRSLAVLFGLARRVAGKPGAPLLDGPLALPAMVRLGLLGI